MNQFGPYSKFKLMHNQDRVREIRDGIPFPINLQFILSNKCNLSCSFCTYRNDRFYSSENFKEHASKVIETKKSIEIIDDFAANGGKSVVFSGGGEPTVHPDFHKICARAIFNGLDVALITNGVKINQEAFATMLSSVSFKWIRVSLDAGTRETYSRIKNTDEKTFDVVMDNVAFLAKNANNTRIGVGFVATGENFSELYPIVEKVRSLGIDSFRIRGVFGDTDFYRDGVEQINDACKKCEDLSTEEFRVENFFDSSSITKATKMCQDTCGYQLLCTYIGADLNVYTCCLYAYNDIGIKGSIKDRKLSDFWYSDEHSDFISKFDARECPNCSLTFNNELISYIVNSNPDDVNFI